MQFSCYIEINVICLILQGIFYWRLHQRRSMLSTADKVMKNLLVTVGVLCVSDILAIVSRGRFFPGARVVIEGSNLVYLVMITLISVLWGDYVAIRLGKKMEKKWHLLHMLPFILFVSAAVLNPLHHFFFSIDENNLYMRGPGVFVHWIVSWYYLLSSGFWSYRAIRSAGSRSARNEYLPLLNFLILPAIGCLGQMAFYGVTAVQAGVTLSLVLVSLQFQDNQVSSDELTGINNRKAMRRFVENTIRSGEGVVLNVIMLDVNRFKMINDTYGHSVGDMALCDTAEMLKKVCNMAKAPLFLCRFGGDEFVLIGRNIGHEGIEEVVGMIRQVMADFERTKGSKPYTLDVSIGHASGLCDNYDDFTHYMRLADENMYDDKKRRQ